MIPIKNPNISTNRYKELLRTEKYCDKLQKEYFNYIETSQNRMEELCNEIGDLEERIDKLEFIRKTLEDELISIYTGEYADTEEEARKRIKILEIGE